MVRGKKHKGRTKSKKNKKFYQEKTPNFEREEPYRTPGDSELKKIIENEYVSLTDGITYFDPYKGPIKKDYFIWWKMEGLVTHFEKGIIMVVDDEGSYYYLKQALERKYKIRIPDTEEYESLLNSVVERYRKDPNM